MCKPASEVTGPLLGVEVGQIAWPKATFGTVEQLLHADQQTFLTCGVWVYFCAAKGDRAGWTEHDQQQPEGSKKWVNRELDADNSFGDGGLFLHVLTKVKDHWRLLGASLLMPHDMIPESASEQQLKNAVTLWLRSEHINLNRPDIKLTHAGQCHLPKLSRRVS